MGGRTPAYLVIRRIAWFVKPPGQGAIEQTKLTEHKAELSNIFDSLTPTR